MRTKPLILIRSIRCLVFAAMLLSVCIHASCLAQTSNEPSEYREFKDRRGRPIQARVVDVSDGAVTIQRRDGRKFTVDVSVFSQADQDYIRGLTEPSESEVASDNWPSFRGPGGMGVSNTTGLPLEWDANNNVAWKTPLPGAGTSSPITFGDHIYLTCYSGYFVPHEPGGSLDQLKRHLIALRRDNGEIV